MSENILPETLTPIPNEENELKENQSYSCTECSSLIEITSLDEINNILSFKCPLHGANTMTIKDYLTNMVKNTFLYSTCSSCKKNQKQINNNEIFNYCTKCKLIICNNCLANHDREHYIIKNNKNLTVCPLHPKNNNLGYCLDCNCHICKECMKHRKHMEHKKKIFQEIEPSEEEINSLSNVIKQYKDDIKHFETEKYNEIIKIESELNQEKDKEEDDYKKLVDKTEKNKDIELKESKANFEIEINEIKRKCQKECEEKRKIFENNKESINNKYEKIENNNQENFEKKCKFLEQKFGNEKKRIENQFKDKIDTLEELLKINDIIFNTYNTSKENYFHSINIINLLVNYYNKGNKIIEKMKDNEDFMETIRQREYDLNKIQLEDANPRKRDSSIEEKKISNQNSESLLINYNYYFPKSIQDIKHTKVNSINKGNNKTYINAKSKEKIRNISSYNDKQKSEDIKINFKMSEENSNKNSTYDLLKYQTNDKYSNDS
mgnify:CR=1 FL=1